SRIASHFLTRESDQMAAGLFAAVGWLVGPYNSIDEIWSEAKDTARCSGYDRALITVPLSRLSDDADLTDVERSVVGALWTVRGAQQTRPRRGSTRLARILLAASGVMPYLSNSSLQPLLAKLCADFHAPSTWSLPLARFWQ